MLNDTTGTPSRPHPDWRHHCRENDPVASTNGVGGKIKRERDGGKSSPLRESGAQRPESDTEDTCAVTVHTSRRAQVESSRQARCWCWRRGGGGFLGGVTLRSGLARGRPPSVAGSVLAAAGRPPFGVSGPHGKKSDLGPHVKYTTANEN